MASTTTTTTGKEEEEELLPPVVQQHPSHHHPLQLLHSSNHSSISISIAPSCHLCHRKKSRTSQAYTCQERCDIYWHRLCVEAPSQIDLHPLHLEHPLILRHNQNNFDCDACGEDFYHGSSFRCLDCQFDLDIACAISTLSDEGMYQCGNTSEQITLPLHLHSLTSFTKRHDFVWDSDCFICKGRVEEDGYMCLLRQCKFVIHKKCIRDLYYADGTKALQVYHGHPLDTFVEEDTGSRTCSRCGSDESGEFICCETCRVFYHRNCFQVPEIIQYPSHIPNHTLVLFWDASTQRQCQSCSISLEDEIHYRCTSCEFFVHVRCASEVLAYSATGMSAKIKLSWHHHQLLLCHRTESTSNRCFYCRDESIGPTYLCEKKDCGFLLHKRCMEIESTITHPHHPDHPLILCERGYDDTLQWCNACGFSAGRLMFSCEHCSFDLHEECAALFPTHKHYLHEHDLQRFEKHGFTDCNRCRTYNDSTLFRCVRCDFNLHEKCMDLPQEMKNDKIHWHSLTLHKKFLEDNTGEYYCEHCEKMRDPQLGVYLCGHCKISMPRIYHIHCVIPELAKLYDQRPSSFEKLNEQIDSKGKEVRAMEEKLKETAQKFKEETQNLEEAKRQLNELMKRRNQILDKDS